jgi:hypothetical protein
MANNDHKPPGEEDALARSHLLRVALIGLAIVCNVAAPLTKWPAQVRLMGYGLVTAALMLLALAYAQSGTDAADTARRRLLALGGLSLALLVVYALAVRSLRV